MNITFKVKNVAKVMNQLGRLSKDMEQPFREVVQGGAQLIRGDAIKDIQTGSKTGKVYEKYNPRRTHRASAPGESPASDTGNLVRNIRVKQNTPDEVFVESNAPYSSYLEFGTSKMLPRPFLFPAYERNRDKITKAVFNRILRAIGDLTKWVIIV